MMGESDVPYQTSTNPSTDFGYTQAQLHWWAQSPLPVPALTASQIKE